MNLSTIRHVIAVLWTVSRGMDRLVKAVIRASPFRYSTEGHFSVGTVLAAGASTPHASDIPRKLHQKTTHRRSDDGSAPSQACL